MTRYLIDANVLIQAHQEDYPLDIAINFWEKIKELADAGVILSIDKVRDELYIKDDDPLTDWCRTELPETFFHSSQEAISEYGQLIQWSANSGKGYKTNAIAEFAMASNADAWLIASAIKNDCVISTLEIASPQRQKRIMIPDVCVPFSVRCVRTMEMFRELGVTF